MEVYTEQRLKRIRSLSHKGAKIAYSPFLIFAYISVVLAGIPSLYLGLVVTAHFSKPIVAHTTGLTTLTLLITLFISTVLMTFYPLMRKYSITRNLYYTRWFRAGVLTQHARFLLNTLHWTYIGVIVLKGLCGLSMVSLTISLYILFSYWWIIISYTIL